MYPGFYARKLRKYFFMIGNVMVMLMIALFSTTCQNNNVKTFIIKDTIVKGGIVTQRL